MTQKQRPSCWTVFGRAVNAGAYRVAISVLWVLAMVLTAVVSLVDRALAPITIGTMSFGLVLWAVINCGVADCRRPTSSTRDHAQLGS